MRKINDFVTNNILPFPNPIDGIIGFYQIMDYLWYKLTGKENHTVNYNYWKNLAK